MTEIRCVKCNRLLMKAKNVFAEIKCPKCGYMNHIDTFDGSIQATGTGGRTFVFQKDGSILYLT